MLIEKQEKWMVETVFALPDVPFSDTGFICIGEQLLTFSSSKAETINPVVSVTQM